LTNINSKVNIEVVDQLFVGRKFSTCVWISKRAGKSLAKFVKVADGKRLLLKLRHYSTEGFAGFEYSKGPIRHEGSGVFRIGDPASLIRLIGFYIGARKDEFVIMDSFKKRGTRLSSSDRARVKEVARIKKHKLWKKAAG
jgi:hypothetical protein